MNTTTAPEAPATAAADHVTARGVEPEVRWVESLRSAAVVFVTVRVAIALLTVLGMALVPPNLVMFDQLDWELTGGWGTVLTAWERWDGTWYLYIIENGYEPAADPPSAWFPVYPFLARFLRPVVGGDALLAALLVSNAAFLGALTVLHRLTAHEYGRHVAQRAVLYLAVSPFALFFLAPYSESLFLLLALLTFWGARRRMWWLAAAAGALASGTRSAGVLLALPVAVEALRAAWRLTGGARWRMLAAGLSSAAVVPVGLLAYLGYWQLRRDDALFPLRVQRTAWQHEPEWPWRTLTEGFRQGTAAIGTFGGDQYPQVELLLTASALVLAVWVVWRTPLPYWSWGVLSMLLPLSTPIPDKVLLSVPRYFLVVFPLVWALVRFADRFRAHSAVVGVSSALLALFTVLHVTGYWIY